MIDKFGRILAGAIALAGFTAALLPAVVQAQDRPLRVILPVSAGSGVDTIMRAAALSLSKVLGGQSVVLENLPGAGSITGTAALVKAAPDGFTIAIVSNNHVINPSVYKHIPFDSLKDITPISVLGETPFVLVVNPKVPANNAKELQALLKSNPGKFNYASAGNGTINHLGGEMFAESAGVQMRHIPYKGTGAQVVDLIGGQVEIGFVAVNAVQGHLKNGTLRALAAASRERIPSLPDLQTLAEQGFPNVDASGWFAAIGPAKLPAAKVKQLHDAFVAAFATPEVIEAMTRQGNVIKPSTPIYHLPDD